MQTLPNTTDHRRATLLTATFAVLWVVLAVWRATVTYHLAPAIVAGVASALGATTPKSRTRLAAFGLTVALAGSLLLNVMGRLDGPSLLPFGGAMAEAVIFAVAGSVVGWVFGGLARTS